MPLPPPVMMATRPCRSKRGSAAMGAPYVSSGSSYTMSAARAGVQGDADAGRRASARQITQIDILGVDGMRLDVAKLDQRLDRGRDDVGRNRELAGKRLQLLDVIVVGLRGDRRVELGGARQDPDRLVAVGRIVQPVD